MFKMDFLGNGVLIERSGLIKSLDMRPDVYTFEKFRYMCILSGCDYLPSLSGIGLVKACKVFKLTRQTDMQIVSICVCVSVGCTYIHICIVVSHFVCK